LEQQRGLKGKYPIALNLYHWGMDGLEVRELRYFVAVAEELNFGRAADRLGIAQPPLSRAIRRIEERLGVRLVERTTRHVALTSAGTVLLQQSRTALDAVAAAGRRAQRAGDLSTPLSLAVKPSGDVAPLRALLDAYAASDPRLPAVEVEVCGFGELAGLLRDGRADVALLRTPFTKTGLDHEPLATEPRVAVVARDHMLAKRNCVRRMELADEPIPRWRRPAADTGSVAYWNGLDCLPEPARPTVPAGPVVGDMDQLIEVVALGQAVAFLPASVAGRYAGAEIGQLQVGDLSPSTVAVAWPEDCCSLAVAALVRAACTMAMKDQATAIRLA
jgi:DNA-binding transcriptional LysR family regulator